MNRIPIICLASIAGFFVLAFAGLSRAAQPDAQPGVFGKIERLDPAFDQVIAPDAKLEKLAEGFDWSEGPVWIKAGGYLLFSDVPQNVILKWQAGQGISEYRKPSGYSGSTPRGGEPGSNGLTIDPQGRLVICQHGDRQIARFADGKFTPIVDRYEGKRFNSPNDVIFDSRGNMFFTDPPYGLLQKNDDPKKEIPFNGVYRYSADGKLTLLTKELSYPNGLALSPDEKTLYVANSDPEKAVWMAFELKDDGTIENGRLFFDATALAKKGLPGLPDGMKVDSAGHVIATGPGGVLVFSPQGKHLGTILLGNSTGNCAFGDDGHNLYITSDMNLCRIKLVAGGVVPPAAGKK